MAPETHSMATICPPFLQAPCPDRILGGWCLGTSDTICFHGACLAPQHLGLPGAPDNLPGARGSAAGPQSPPGQMPCPSGSGSALLSPQPE